MNAPAVKKRSMEELIEEGVGKRQHAESRERLDTIHKAATGILGSIITALLIAVMMRAGTISTNQITAESKLANLEKAVADNQQAMRDSMAANQANVLEKITSLSQSTGAQVARIESILTEYRRDQDTLRDRVTQLATEMQLRREMTNSKPAQK